MHNALAILAIHFRWVIAVPAILNIEEGRKLPQQANNNMSLNLGCASTDRTGPSEAAWEAMKTHIHDEYIKAGKTLKAVIDVMKDKHEFEAT